MRSIENYTTIPFNVGDRLVYLCSDDDEEPSLVVADIHVCRGYSTCTAFKAGRCTGYIMECEQGFDWCMIPDDFEWGG